MITIIAILSFVAFHIWADRSRLRELWPSAVTSSYYRLMMQYIFGESLKLWEYKNMPLPINENSHIPFVLDLSFYPIAGLFFIQYMPSNPKKRWLYFLAWMLGMLAFQMLLVGTHHLVLKRWNLVYSILNYSGWVLVLYWQHKLFRKWCLQ